ncbi:MAG: hypothetical protein NUV65_01790 [Candidatus Roizmanbacteria bacterium]|nr:hypothetical protein [Candidatus Roizmanbacteria bacterium]
MINENFVIIGVIIQSVGGVGYFLDTIKGKIQPNKVSWLLWAIAPLVAFAAEVSQGVGIHSLTTFIVGFIPLIIFFASFVNKKATWQLSKFDIICGTLSIAGLAMWAITRVGNIAILFAILADGLAAVPTIVKSFKEPSSESSLIYGLGVINAGIALLATSNWNFEHYAFPLYLFIVGTVLYFLIQFKLGKFISNIFR